MMVLPPSYSAMVNGLGNHHRWQNRTSGGNVPAWAGSSAYAAGKGRARSPPASTKPSTTHFQHTGRTWQNRTSGGNVPAWAGSSAYAAGRGRARSPPASNQAQHHSLPAHRSDFVREAYSLQRHRLLRCHHLLHRVFALPAEPPPDRLQRWRGRCGYQRRLGHRWAKNVHAGQTRRGDGRAAGGGEVARTAPNKIPP